MNDSKIPIIAGSGRSGTTWVLDALAIPNKKRTIFEPLHPACVSEAGDFAYQYFEPNSKNDALNHFFQKLLSGNIRGIWIDYRVRTDRIRPALNRFRSPRDLREWYLRLKKLAHNKKRYHPHLKKTPMVKMIRGNLLLGWLARNFPVNIVLLVRHPGAVIESMNRLHGDDWEPKKTLSMYKHQEGLLKQVTPEAQKLVSTASTDLERYMLIWCLENALPIQKAAKNNVRVIFYENLVLHPRPEWKSLALALELEKVPDESILKFPSQQAAPGKESEDYAKTKLGRWIEHFSTYEMDLMQDILDTFEVDCYQMSDPVPVIKQHKATD